MMVAASSRACSTASTVLGSMRSCSMTPFTASCNDPPSEVKSFWYSIRTTAVFLGSIRAPSQSAWQAARRKQPTQRAALHVRAYPRNTLKEYSGISTHQVNNIIKQHGQAICLRDKTSRKDEHPFSAHHSRWSEKKQARERS